MFEKSITTIYLLGRSSFAFSMLMSTEILAISDTVFIKINKTSFHDY